MGALGIAAMEGYMDVVQLLLNAGGRPQVLYEEILHYNEVPFHEALCAHDLPGQARKCWTPQTDVFLAFDGHRQSLKDLLTRRSLPAIVTVLENAISSGSLNSEGQAHASPAPLQCDSGCGHR